MVNRVILKPNGIIVRSRSSVIFHLLFCIQDQQVLSSCSACSEVVFEFEEQPTRGYTVYYV